MASPAVLEREVPEDADGRRGLGVMVALVLLACLLFLGYGARMIVAPFGDSHDGRNGGLWAVASRALREDGPVRSRLGTRAPEHGIYANHPPLIVVETAVAEALGAGSRAATRAPAWLGSLVALGLLAALLRGRGLAPGAVGIAVLLTAAMPMFLVFGTMLDTPVTSLPFGLAVLLLWDRARQGRPVRRTLVALVVALAVLAGWQSLLVAAVVASWALIRLVRDRDRRRRSFELPFIVGALVGAAALLVWLWWAFGGTVRPLVDAYLTRAGQGAQPVALADLLREQRKDLGAMFGLVGLLGLVGIGVALARRPTRALATVALALTVPYPLVLRTGAMNHEYWDYWFLLPVAVGLAAGADFLMHRLGGERFVVAGACALSGVLALGAWLEPGPAGWGARRGVAAGELAQAAALAPGQEYAWYAGAVGEEAHWLGLATRRLVRYVAFEDAGRLAVERPGDLVLLALAACVDGALQIRYSMEAPADLPTRPPDPRECVAQPAASAGR